MGAVLALLGIGGGAVATGGTSLFAGLIGSLFKGLFDSLFGYLDKQADKADQREVGRQEVIAAQSKEEADAERRMAKVAVPDVDEFLDTLDHGKQF